MSGQPYYTDESVTLWHGDALDVARTLPDGAADCMRYVGIDLNREYLDLSLRTRLAQSALTDDMEAS